MASAVLKLNMERGVVEDEQIACYDLLRTLVGICDHIHQVAREMLPAWEAEEEERRYAGSNAENVRRRLDNGDLPFASSRIMPVEAAYGMSRDRYMAEFHTGSAVAGEFMERVADDYEGARPLCLARGQVGVGVLSALAHRARSRYATRDFAGAPPPMILEGLPKRVHQVE